MISDIALGIGILALATGNIFQHRFNLITMKRLADLERKEKP